MMPTVCTLSTRSEERMSGKRTWPSTAAAWTRRASSCRSQRTAAWKRSISLQFFSLLLRRKKTSRSRGRWRKSSSAAICRKWRKVKASTDCSSDVRLKELAIWPMFRQVSTLMADLRYSSQSSTTGTICRNTAARRTSWMQSRSRVTSEL